MSFDVFVKAVVIAAYLSVYNKLKKMEARNWYINVLWFSLLGVAIIIQEPWILVLWIVPVFEFLLNKLSVRKIERRLPDIDIDYVKKYCERWLDARQTEVGGKSG
jgi:hypothetical protein